MDDIIQILKRERLARKAAEKLMEEKSLELYKSNQSLIQLNESLEIKVHKYKAVITALYSRYKKRLT